MRLNLNKESDFWSYDFNRVNYNEKLKPVMPRLKMEPENKLSI
jgi:hypothetical protein